MAQGRGSAMVATLFLCMLIIVLHSEMAHAATYTVGDSATYTVGDLGGWTFNAAGWLKGKQFRAGETLG
ncbi:basic blue protein [Quercus suber]|uniref:Basic blue protein n=1 Tax=Quercus suber TaxID=58331 RepID=A0AAW0LUG3_QUESU